MASDDEEMPILTTEENVELDMPRLEVEAEPSPNEKVHPSHPSTSKKAPLKTSRQLIDPAKALEEQTLKVISTYDNLYQATSISDHESVLKEREKNFEPSGKNEIILPSAIFSGLKYRFILNGCNRSKTLRFYSCYSCIMIKKIEFYKDFINADAPIPTIVVKNGLITDINADRPNDVAHLCTPKLTISSKSGSDIMVDMSKLPEPCQFPVTYDHDLLDDDGTRFINLDNNKVYYSSKVVSLKYEFQSLDDPEFEAIKKKKAYVLSCVSCEKTKRETMSPTGKTIYVPQLFFQDGVFIHVNPDMPLNGPHICARMHLDTMKQKKLDTLKMNHDRLKRKLEADQRVLKNSPPPSTFKWKPIKPDAIRQNSSHRLPSILIKPVTIRQKDAMPLQTCVTVSHELQAHDEKVTRRRISGTIITPEEIDKYVSSSSLRGQHQTSVKIEPGLSVSSNTLPKLSSRDPIIESGPVDEEPMERFIIKEEPKSPRHQEAEAEQMTTTHLRLNIDSGLSRLSPRNTGIEMEDPPNLMDQEDQASASEILRTRSEMVRDTVAQFLAENAPYLRQSKVPLHKKMGPQINPKNGNFLSAQKKAAISSINRPNLSNLAKMGSKVIEMSPVGKLPVFRPVTAKELASQKSTSASPTPAISVFKEVKQELELEPDPEPAKMMVEPSISSDESPPILDHIQESNSNDPMPSLVLTETVECTPNLKESQDFNMDLDLDDDQSNTMKLLGAVINAIHNRKIDEDMAVDKPSTSRAANSELPKLEPAQKLVKKKRGRPSKLSLSMPENMDSKEPPMKRFHKRYSLRETIKPPKVETPEVDTAVMSSEDSEAEDSTPKSAEVSQFDPSETPQDQISTRSSSPTHTPPPHRTTSKDQRSMAAQNWKLKQRKKPLKETEIWKQLNRLNFGTDYSGFTMVYAESEKFTGIEYTFMYDPNSREYQCTACQNAITYAQLMLWNVSSTPARLEISEFGILSPPDDSLHVCLPNALQPPSSTHLSHPMQIINTSRIVPSSRNAPNNPSTSNTPSSSRPQVVPKILKPRFVPVKASELEKVSIKKEPIEDMPKLIPTDSADDEDAKTVSSDISEPPELSAISRLPPLVPTKPSSIRFIPVNQLITTSKPKVAIVRPPSLQAHCQSNPSTSQLPVVKKEPL